MKNKGFTLAEVLITLGIIGITAALTLPALINMHQEAGMGPRLAKAQQTMEDAIGRVMVDNPDRTLSEMKGELGSKLPDYIINYPGILKDGTQITLDIDTAPTVSGNKKALGESMAQVTVNIQPKAANNPGINIFYFALTTKGAVIPVGCAKEIAENDWKVPENYNKDTCSGS